MLSSWGRFVWRIESFDLDSHPLPLTPTPLAPTLPIVVARRAPSETRNMMLRTM
uniref:Uncharacterized protein n=1 Tax=Monodon monoceros TaxID=40151 RepID=A0A8C6AZ19_MONMO